MSGESVYLPTDTKELDAEGRESIEKLVEKLEEDEMASILRGKLTACPYYHPGQSDYYLAGKQ